MTHFNNLRSLNGGGFSAFEKDNVPIAQQELMFSGTVSSKFESSGPTRTEQLQKLAVDDGRSRQRTTINTCSAWW
ncbi:hypothetical protein TNCV_3017991 [Trichonephila clavipes]|nr:hypothetical protein TNCV_3017991 [Trichonephila clavipes]